MLVTISVPVLVNVEPSFTSTTPSWELVTVTVPELARKPLSWSEPLAVRKPVLVKVPGNETIWPPVHCEQSGREVEGRPAGADGGSHRR